MIVENVKKIKDELSELEKLRKSEKNRYIKETSMLRVLSSVGLSIAQFIHEIKYYIDNINSDIDFLLRNLQNDAKLLETAVILNNNFSSFHTYTSYFDDMPHLLFEL